MSMWKKKVRMKGDFFKAKFHLVRTTVKTLRKVASLQTLRPKVLINIGLIESNEKAVVAFRRGSRLATKVIKSYGPTEFARAAVRKHTDHDQFFCGSDDYVLCCPDLYSLYQVVTRNL